MPDEKKKGGFWSWFGLGKNKQEESEEPKEQASQEKTSHYVQESQPEAQETAEKNTALPEEAETENTLTEDTSMVHASQPVPSDETPVDVGVESNPVIEETMKRKHKPKVRWKFPMNLTKKTAPLPTWWKRRKNQVKAAFSVAY